MSSQQWGNRPPQWGQSGGAWNRAGAPPTYGRQAAPGQSPWGPPQGQPSQGQPPQGQWPPPGYPQPYAPGQLPPGYFPPPQRPQRRNPMRTLFLALVALSAIALVGLVAVNLSTDSSDVAYQNDDYQVPAPDENPPELPTPTSYAEAEKLITDNTFYDQTTPIPVRCTAGPIDVATASDAQLESHFNNLMECLVRVWQPPVEAAGYVIVRPTVTIYGEKVTTRCGDAGVNAFYCAADQQIYFSSQLADQVSIVKTDRWGADVVMAHEFGHALQARTAILISAKALGQEADSEETELEMSRRLEVQADCLSGMFMRSVSLSLGIQQSDLQGIEDVFRAVGDDTLSGKSNVSGDHGLAASRVRWGTIGLGTSDVGACNTFVAPKSTVR